MTEANDFKQRADDLAARNRERRANEEKEPSSGEKKMCPFMSKPPEAAMCTPSCKLYRSKPEGYECTFQELRAISWNTKKKKQ